MYRYESSYVCANYLKDILYYSLEILWNKCHAQLVEQGITVVSFPWGPTMLLKCMQLKALAPWLTASTNWHINVIKLKIYLFFWTDCLWISMGVVTLITLLFSCLFPLKVDEEAKSMRWCIWITQGLVTFRWVYSSEALRKNVWL